MNPQIVTVNLIPGLSTPAVVRVSQYDVERPITFRVLDGNKAAVFPDDCTATIEATKPSGLGFSLLGTIAPGGMVSFTTGVAMTQECGMIPTEIRFSTNAYGSFPATDIGTANFILAVEPSPHPEGTTDGTQETMQSLETRLQGQIDALDTRVDALEAGQGGGSGLTDDIKTALLQIAQKVAYIDAHGQDYYDDLYDALYNDTTRSVLLVLSHVSSSNTQSTVEVGDSYTTTLTASTNYTINSVTVTMGGVDITSTSYSSGTITIPSVTGNIVITATAVLAAQSITATYTQSGTVYNTDTLDSLKADLVVTANYAGGTSETVPASNYTLSGTLTVGTSTVTVNYAGLTDTFDVTVSHVAVQPIYAWDLTSSLTDSVGGITATTTATLTSGTGLVFSAQNKYCDFGQVYSRNRTYELDVYEIGAMNPTSGNYRRIMCFGTSTHTNSGTAAFLNGVSSKLGWWFYKGSAWDSAAMIAGTSADNFQRDYFNGKTVKIYLDSDGYAKLSYKTIGADDSTYTVVGTSGGVLNDYTNGHVYIGGDQADYTANATFTGFRVYEGEK